MGTLEIDTEIEGSNGCYRAQLSEDWEIWGPNGGYVASIALRAAGAESRFNRPAGFSCQYLSPARFDAVQLNVEILKKGRSVEALKVSILQENKRILEALVWTIDEFVEGYEQDRTDAPEVEDPKEYKSLEELLGPEKRPPHKFWQNVERRPVLWDPSKERKPGPPIWQEWFKFRPQACFENPFVNASRLLILIDTMQWPAMFNSLGDTVPYIAPSLDLNIQFHQCGKDSSWLFCEAIADIAQKGLIGGRARIWSEYRQLLASGSSSLLCVPNPTLEK